MYVNIYFSKH